MSNICGEYESAMNLIINEYRNLKKLIPDHPLLILIKNVDEDGFTTTDEFLKRYDTQDKRKRINHNINVLAEYYIDLKDAVTEKLNKIISDEKKSYEKELWKKMEEKGLVGIIRTHITHNKVPLII